MGGGVDDFRVNLLTLSTSAGRCFRGGMTKGIYATSRPSLLEKTGLLQAVGHVPTRYWVGVAVQIPASRVFDAPWERGLDRLFVAPQMIKHSGLVGEPGGGPRIAGTKAPSRLDRFEGFLVAAV